MEYSVPWEQKDKSNQQFVFNHSPQEILPKNAF